MSPVPDLMKPAMNIPSLTPFTGPAADRIDLLGPVHKALRRFMFDTLVRVGAFDVTMRGELEETINLVERLLFVMGEQQSGAACTVSTLRRAPASERRAVSAQLYRELTELVTLRLYLMLEEEAHTLPTLWHRHTDSELARIRLDRLAALDVNELREAMHWMAGALTPQELADVLEDLHATTGTLLFRTALDTLREGLDAQRWARVTQSLARATGTGAAKAAMPHGALRQDTPPTQLALVA
ncbi:MAG: hypothetical protein JWP52_1827 [Rhizobacter sp.]|nr:hypothetical protein [Rhizobacter sp.]